MKTSTLGRIALAAGVAALTAGTLPATAHADDSKVERKTFPVMVEFSDASFQDADAVKAGTPDTYFGTGKDSLASFFTEVSRGQYTTVPAVEEGVVGPVTLPMTAAGCDHNRINTLTREALAAQGLVMGEDYESLSVIFPAQKTGRAWAGLGSVPTSRAHPARLSLLVAAGQGPGAHRLVRSGRRCLHALDDHALPAELRPVVAVRGQNDHRSRNAECECGNEGVDRILVPVEPARVLKQCHRGQGILLADRFHS